MLRAPKSVEVGLDLKFFKITGRWEPNDVERLAAWELYVELITRVAVVPLPAGDGLLREAPRVQRRNDNLRLSLEP